MNPFAAEKDINIVFLGGSITEGAGASDVSKCYANLTGEWLKETYGAHRVHYHNKGVGGTPSAYGLLRFGRDVAACDPDMVFIEFAVNDGGEDTRKYVEGLVRSLISLPSKPYVVFLYTTNEIYTTHTAYFEEVAQHYGIPQISLKDALKRHLNGENAREAGFLKDSVHPSDEGYKVYFEEIRRCLSCGDYYKRPAADKEKLVDSVCVRTVFTPASAVSHSEGWTCGGGGERPYMVGGVGEWLEAEFDGTILAFEHGLHKDSAEYNVYVDGRLIDTGDPWYRDFLSNQLVMGVYTFSLPDGHHHLRLETVKSKKDGRTNRQVFLYNIITGKTAE